MSSFTNYIVLSWKRTESAAVTMISDRAAALGTVFLKGFIFSLLHRKNTDISKNG